MQECGIIFGTRKAESGKAIRNLSAKLGVVDRLSAETREPVRNKGRACCIWWDIVEMPPVAT